MPRKHRPPLSGTCIYCGTSGEITRDHVPPKNLFPKGTLGLVTRPACQKCNNEAKLDDEYFRLNITLRHDIANTPPDSDVTLESIAKLYAPEKLGLALRMLSQRREFKVESPAGEHLGWVPGMSVDSARIRRVLRRTVRGLFSAHMGVAIPVDHCVAVWWLSEPAAVEFLPEFGLPPS